MFLHEEEIHWPRISLKAEGLKAKDDHSRFTGICYRNFDSLNKCHQGCLNLGTCFQAHGRDDAETRQHMAYRFLRHGADDLRLAGGAFGWKHVSQSKSQKIVPKRARTVCFVL